MVLLVALVGIPGEAADQGDDQGGVAAQGQQKIQQPVVHEHAQHAHHQTGDQQRHIQPVMAVAAHHKALGCVQKIHAGLSQPACDVFHWDHLFCKVSMPIIWHESPITTPFTESSQKIRIPVTEILKNS